MKIYIFREWDLDVQPITKAWEYWGSISDELCKLSKAEPFYLMMLLNAV